MIQKVFVEKKSIFKDCSELDVYDMMSQILSVLIGFTQDRALTRKGIKKW